MDRLLEDDRRLLEQFFGAYFHEDWACDSNSSDEVVQLFMHDASRDEVDRLRDAISRLSECDRNNQQMEESIFRDFGCSFLPSGAGFTVKEWLQSIIAILSTKAD